MNIKRILSAGLLIPILYLYITQLSQEYFLALLCVISIFAQWEFQAMYKTPKKLAIIGIVVGTLMLSSAYFYPIIVLQPLSLMLGFILISSARLLFKKTPVSSLKDMSPVFVGLCYIPNLLVAQWFLRIEGIEWIFLLYVSVWLSDSFAYYIGKNLGRKKLYIEVSPQKTVEGAIGSLIGGTIGAMVLWLIIPIGNLRLPIVLLIGVTIGLITIIGDLVESMFKRDTGIKDSGSIIPGHGGVLDRIDSALFAGVGLYLIKLINGF